VICGFFFLSDHRAASIEEETNMGWIPCSGYSGTKNKIEKMEVQDSLVGQIKATPGTFLVYIGKKKGEN